MKRFSFLLALILLCWTYLPAAADGPMIGEVRIWTTDTPPAGWVLCDGTSYSKSIYSDLFDVIGTSYGGSASTFRVPDLTGNVPVGFDSGISQFDVLGETGGEINHTLTINEMPSHTHTQNAHGHNISVEYRDGGSFDPSNGQFLLARVGGAAGTSRTMGTQNVTATNQNTGGGQPHNNLQPYITLNFIIYTGLGVPTPTPTPTATPTETPTPGPTPTGTITPTATSTGTLYLPMIVTTTLQSGTVLSVPEQVSFGQLIISAIVVSLISVFALDFIFRVVYRR